MVAYNDTSVQPQNQAMGAVAGDPGEGEMPMMRNANLLAILSQFMLLPLVLGMVVSECNAEKAT